jgi:hypothetical protein
MIDAAGFFANSATSMTIKTRNRLLALCILAFPFLVLLGFVISESINPLSPPEPSPKSSLDSSNGTNTVYSPR